MVVLEPIPDPAAAAREDRLRRLRAAASKGGKTTKERYGSDFFAKIGKAGGSKGGKATLERHGRGHFARIGALRARYPDDHTRIGRPGASKGGRATLAAYGREHYVRMAVLSAERRRAQKGDPDTEGAAPPGPAESWRRLRDSNP